MRESGPTDSSVSACAFVRGKERRHRTSGERNPWERLGGSKGLPSLGAQGASTEEAKDKDQDP